MSDSKPQATPANILARIRKLQALTTSNGCTEHEALAAMAVLDRLMSEYNPSERELRAEADLCAVDSLVHLDEQYSDWSMIVGPIARVWGTKHWFSRVMDDSMGLGFAVSFYHIKFFGYPMDIAASVAMVAMCFGAIQTSSMAYAKSIQKGTPAAQRQHLARSFRMGMGDRLRERLDEIRTQREAKPTGTGLIVIKDQLVTNAFSKFKADTGLELYTRARSTKAVDHAAFTAGSHAANHVGINPERLTTTPSRPAPAKQIT